MVRPRKKIQGIGLYPQDWARVKKNLKPDEHMIEFIQNAILAENEIREGKRKMPQAMTSLTDL